MAAPPLQQQQQSTAYSARRSNSAKSRAFLASIGALPAEGQQQQQLQQQHRHQQDGLTTGALPSMPLLTSPGRRFRGFRPSARHLQTTAFFHEQPRSASGMRAVLTCVLSFVDQQFCSRPAMSSPVPSTKRWVLRLKLTVPDGLRAPADAQAAREWQAVPVSASALNACADPFCLDASQQQQQQHVNSGVAAEVPPVQPQPVSGLHHRAASASETRTLDQVRGSRSHHTLQRASCARDDCLVGQGP